MSLLSKAFGDIITFTRASAATRINELGQMETVAANVPRIDYDASGALFNLLPNSNPTWTSVHGATGTCTITTGQPDPYGGNTAQRITAVANSDYALAQTTIPAVTGTYTGGLMVKSATGSNQTFTAWTDSVTPVTVTATAEWSIVSGVQTVTANTLFKIMGGDIYVARIGLFQGTKTAADIFSAGGIPLTTSAAACNPSQVVRKGLLIEEQRTNKCFNSNNFGAWGKTSISVASGTLISPTGGMNADSIIEGNAAAFGNCVSNVVVDTVGTVQTCSIYLKALGRSWAHVYFGQGVANAGAWFNLDTGQVGSRQPNNLSATIKDVGNGWFRCSISAVIVIDSFQIGFGPCLADNNSVYQGVGIPSIGAFGGQIESGNWASSYIQTSTSQVTRAADLPVMNTLSPWWNSNEGSYVGEFSVMAQPQGNTAVIGTFAKPTLAFGASYIKGSFPAVTDVASVPISITPGAVFKAGYAFKSGSFAVSANGSVPAVSAAAVAIGLPSALSLGNEAKYLNGWLRKVRYYPKRLSNAQLQSLTA